MAEMNRRWVFPTVVSSEDKSIERIALTGENKAHELIGVDGSRRFGCRPTSGFRLAHTLNTHANFPNAADRPFSEIAPPVQSYTSTVTDCFPVHFQIREGQFGHGFVYRVKRAGAVAANGNCAIYLDYVPTTSVDEATGWRTVLLSDHTSLTGVKEGDKIDVVSMGRYIFLLIKGKQPRVFYIDYVEGGVAATATFTFDTSAHNSSNTATITLVDSGGTSKTYTVNNDGSANANNLEFLAGTTDDEAGVTTTATNFCAIVNGSTGHNGTIVATNVAGVVTLTQGATGTAGNTSISTSSFDSITSVNAPSAFSGGRPQHMHQVIDGGPGKQPLVSYDSNSIGTTAKDDPPSPRTGGSFPTIIVPRGQLGEQSNDPHGSSEEDPHFYLFPPGDYSFAYYMADSLTGRRSPLSEISSRTNDRNAIDSAGRYIYLDVEIDTEKFDQIFIFRSVKLQSVGGTYTGSILHLDNIYNISDAKTEQTSGFIGIEEQVQSSAPFVDQDRFKIFRCYYELDDLALAMQDIYMEKLLADEKMPFSGSGVAFGGSLIVSDPDGDVTEPISNLDSKVRNVGEIRWSSLVERSPEIFPINNKYSPDVFQNRVTRLARAGDFVVGFSKDRIYHMRRNGIFLKIDEMHAGFGLVSDQGYATAGPLIYFVTSKGLKAIANNGQLDDVKALDNLLLEDWSDDLSSIRLAFDPYASCLFVHNPNKEQTVCMWFSTGRITEIHDVPFTDLRTGIFPEDFTRNAYDNTTPTTTSTTSMVERTFFLQNHPSSTTSNIGSNWRPRVYILDVDREKKQVNSTDVAVGQPALRTLDFPGDSIFTVKSVTQSSGSTEIVLKSGTSGSKQLSAPLTLETDLVGAKVYIISSSTNSNVGSSQTIFNHEKGLITSGGSTISITTGKFGGVAAGDVIAISPIFFRYVGSALPMVRTEKGKTITTYDLFQNKQLSSVGCHFTDVSGGVTGYKFFRGLAYNTESDSAAVSAFPLDFSGQIIGDSIKTGESDDYAAFTASGLTTTGRHGIQDSALNPGIEIFCPDIDFKLMAVICRGRSTGTDTGERNT